MTMYRINTLEPARTERARALLFHRLFVKSVLEQATSYDWSLQGLGMFRMYLSREVRLHVWDDRFAFPAVHTIHTHPWHFRSYVLSGAITDRLYDPRISGEPTARLMPTHMRQRIVCGPGGCAVGEPERWHLKLLQEVTVNEGEGYGLTADAAHESIPEPGTITIIEREFLDDTEHAYVFYPLTDDKWRSAEPRYATLDEVKAMSALALKRLEKSL